MRLPLLLGLCVLTVACTQTSDKTAATAAPAPLSTAELQAVTAVDAAFAAGMNAKDAAAASALYAEDAKLMPPDAPILEGAAIRSTLGGLIDGGASNFVLTSTTAYGVGDLAYVVGTASFTMGGAAQTVKYTEVLRKGADGKWRYVVDMFSGIAPPAPAAAPASAASK